MPQATHCQPKRWYYFTDATHVNCRDENGARAEPHLWTGWLYITDKKYQTDTTVTVFGYTTGFDQSLERDERWTALEMRRKLTVKTLKNGPPTYVIQEQTL